MAVDRRPLQRAARARGQVAVDAQLDLVDEREEHELVVELGCAPHPHLVLEAAVEGDLARDVGVEVAVEDLVEAVHVHRVQHGAGAGHAGHGAADMAHRVVRVGEVLDALLAGGVPQLAPVVHLAVVDVADARRGVADDAAAIRCLAHHIGPEEGAGPGAVGVLDRVGDARVAVGVAALVLRVHHDLAVRGRHPLGAVLGLLRIFEAHRVVVDQDTAAVLRHEEAGAAVDVGQPEVADLVVPDDLAADLAELVVDQVGLRRRHGLVGHPALRPGRTDHQQGTQARHSHLRHRSSVRGGSPHSRHETLASAASSDKTRCSDDHPFKGMQIAYRRQPQRRLVPSSCATVRHRRFP